MKDLIVSVADIDQKNVLEALLPRMPRSSGTCEFTYEIFANPGHDSASYNNSHEFLRSSIYQYHFALVLLDFEGTGVAHVKTRHDIENDIHTLLNKNGWENRNAAIVIAPELENWMWIKNKHVEDAIGWKRNESLYEWARNEGHLASDELKPARPKEALEAALKISRTPKSAAIYKKIAANVSYRRCEDESFKQLIAKLQEWFPNNTILDI